MTSFKKFFFSGLESTGKGLCAGVSLAVNAGLSSEDSKLTDKQKFAQQVGDLVGSDEFVTELSNKINKPLPGESEDAFVKRAKDVMRNQLRAKLAGNV